MYMPEKEKKEKHPEKKTTTVVGYLTGAILSQSSENCKILFYMLWELLAGSSGGPRSWTHKIVSKCEVKPHAIPDSVCTFELFNAAPCSCPRDFLIACWILATQISRPRISIMSGKDGPEAPPTRAQRRKR